MNNRKSAFTIIEVVLVLAVAGLIFLVVFTAIPRLQASRRDNARKDHARALSALILEHKSNTGSYPLNSHVFDALSASPNPAVGFTDYVEGAGIIDPSGSHYAYQSSGQPAPGELYYYHHSVRCGTPGGAFIWGQTADDFVLRVGLERGDICIDKYGGYQ